MHTSIEPRNRIFLKGYGFLTFEKNMGDSLNGKHRQIPFDHDKLSGTDALKTISKEEFKL